MKEMKKLLDDVVDVSECCIIFSAAKNAEGELEGSVRLKTPKEAKDLNTFLNGTFNMLSVLNKILLEQGILTLENLGKIYSASLMTADLAVTEGINVEDIIVKIEGNENES